MTDFEMNERITEVLAEQEGVYDAWNKRKQKKRTRLHKTYKKEFALKKALEEAPKSFNIYLTSRVLDFYDESIDLVTFFNLCKTTKMNLPNIRMVIVLTLTNTMDKV